MTNFKSKILNSLKHEKQIYKTFQHLSKIQNNLMKNYTNPVFSSNDKNKLLEKYGKIDNIGKSLYRFNTLKQNQMLYEADREKETASNLVLKGGISNCRYIWHSGNSENTCAECAALDGKEFDFEDEVPERPHSNCQCCVEIVEIPDEDNPSKDKQEQESCDCVDTTNDEITSLIETAENFKNEIMEMLNNLFEQMKTKTGQFYEEQSQKIIDKASTWDNAIGDFARNYNDMVEANIIGGDKYFHSKANCEATQRGGAGEVIAEALSLLREIEEGTRKVVCEGEDLIEQIKDANKDMEANKFGREQGKNNPDADCEILIEIFRPKSLPDKY